MKRVLISLIIALICCAPQVADAQKHRHDPNLVNTTAAPKVSGTVVDSDTAGIEAFSDTTGIDTTAQTTNVTIDDWDDEDVNLSLRDIKDLLGIGVGGTVIAILVIILLFLIFALPFILIGFVIYLIVRNTRRNNRAYENNAYHQGTANAMDSSAATGQTAADPVQPQQTQIVSNDYLRRKGVMNIFIAIGLFFFSMFVDSNFFMGVSCIYFFYALGQYLISRPSKRNQQENDFYEEIKDDDVERRN